MPIGKSSGLKEVGMIVYNSVRKYLPGWENATDEELKALAGTLTLLCLESDPKRKKLKHLYLARRIELNSFAYHTIMMFIFKEWRYWCQKAGVSL